MQVDDATPLTHAAGGCNLATARILLMRGASTDAADIAGRTPLHRAAAADGADAERVVALLLENGADTRAVDSNGQPPLSHAAASANGGVIAALLLEAGAPLESRDFVRESPVVPLCASRPRFCFRCCSQHSAA